MIALVDAKRRLLAELCQQMGVERLYLFGSAAKGAFDPNRSDLDFLVSFHTTEPGEYTRNYFALADSLEGLFGRKVDLVTDRMVQNPYFRELVEKTREPIYAA